MEWVRSQITGNSRVAACVREIRTLNYGPYSEARILEVFHNLGESSWPTDDANLERWWQMIMSQIDKNGLFEYKRFFSGWDGKFDGHVMRGIMRAVRAVLIYLAETPALSFNENMRFYMVTANNNPLPESWLHTPPGGIVTVQRMLSLDIPGDDGYLRPWGNDSPIYMGRLLDRYQLAIINAAPGDTSRIRPSPMINSSSHANNHKFKAPPGTLLRVERLERNKWIEEPKDPLRDAHTHIILTEEPNQPPYVVPACIRAAVYW